MGQEEYGGVTQSQNLWGIIQKPEYAHGEDGLDAIVEKEVSTYAAHGNVFADASYLVRNFRSAKAKSRDVRRLRILHGEIPETQTALEEYQKDYRSYANARRQQSREGIYLEQKMKDSERKLEDSWGGKANCPAKRGGNRPWPMAQWEMAGAPLSWRTLAGRHVRP